MSTEIISSNPNETTIQITVQHGKSMLDFEGNLQDCLNQAGCLGVKAQLTYMDTDGSPIQVGGFVMTSKKKKVPKVYECKWGAVGVPRYVYQGSKGGETFCPLDQNARIVVIAQNPLASQDSEVNALAG